MLDFKRGPGAPNYLSRSYQWRLLLLVATLGLVVFLANEARKPENYAWLWAVDRQGGERGESEFAPGQSRQPAGEYFPGVEPDQLAAVRDDYPFLASDTAAWFGLLKILRDTDQEALAAASSGPATYVQLLRQPDAYRGRLVTLRGTMRRVVPMPAPENNDGFEHYYQTWITPQDDPSSLIAVYCLALPQKFPTGMELDEPVSLVGFFFKRWVYHAQDRLRTAPVVLAKTVDWKGESIPVGAALGGGPLPGGTGSASVWLNTGGASVTQPNGPPRRAAPTALSRTRSYADRSLLSDLGMDVSLLDDLKPGPLTSRSRECFYQMLAAVGRAEPGELLATAESDLRRDGREQFSVVPLFNDPKSMRGQLVALSGTAREVLLVHVPDRDIRERFGIDHYYQVSLFTDDSQNNPLVFCAGDIPPGMPTGAGPGYAEDVTVAGFYLKPWAYRSRAAASPEAAAPMRLAPLLIGRDVQWRPAEMQRRNSMAAIAAGVALLLLVAIVWLVLWRTSRADDRFRRETLSRHLGGEPDTSLDAIEIETPEESGTGQSLITSRHAQQT